MSEQDVLDKIDDAIEKIDDAVEKINETKAEVLLSRGLQVPCGYCKGDGTTPITGESCPNCEGLGYVFLKGSA